VCVCSFLIALSLDHFINSISNDQVVIPRFFYWYATDFGVKPDNWSENVQAFRTLASDEMKIKIDRIADNKVSVKFDDYNWTLAPVRIYGSEWEQILRREVSVAPRRSVSTANAAGAVAVGISQGVAAESTKKSIAQRISGLYVADWIIKFPAELIPPFLSVCMKHVETQGTKFHHGVLTCLLSFTLGITKDGIFRFSGNPIEVNQLKSLAAEGTIGESPVRA